MNKEAFCVSYDKINYHASIPQGQDIERILRTREHRIEENILRYLGEYRLGVKFDEIFYKKERDISTEEVYLASGEHNPIRDVFRKAIRAREQKGLSVKREVAECLGFEKLENKLLNSSDNSLFIWVSPPGSKTDGYGDYSFTFIGQKIKDPKNGEEKIRVIPYRNILSFREHKVYLKYFSKDFSKDVESFNSDIDFLANPIVFPIRDSIQKPEDILYMIGETEKISTDWLRRLKMAVNSLTQKYIELVKENASDYDLTRAKFAIENYTISIKNILHGKTEDSNVNLTLGHDLDRAIEMWGRYAPPKAGGICGSSSSSTTLSEFHEEFNKKWEYHTGDCVNCGVKGVDVGPCNICKKCEKKFD